MILSQWKKPGTEIWILMVSLTVRTARHGLYLIQQCPSALCVSVWFGKFVGDIGNMNTVEHNRVFIITFRKYCIMLSNSFESRSQIQSKETDRRLSIGYEDVSLQLGWSEWKCILLSLCGCPAREKRDLLDSWRLGINENLFVPYRYIISSIAPLNPVFHPLSLKVVSEPHGALPSDGK